ncbi:YqgQ family protein [uncultured Limosilactobacillus sp.]|uniref:YqgQ family protein n=1 Tax=uncultured Limosilactobacillus sp. TaxID=2837629 RepID=UPI0025D276F4|nr:YqgQ family protein [uncultured Limosilactobacillus sp.]
MRTLYDVQQLLKRFDVFVYVGKRLWDIELMALEIDNLYRVRVIDKAIFLQAKLVLNREHQYELKMAKERKNKNGNKEQKVNRS